MSEVERDAQGGKREIKKSIEGKIVSMVCDNCDKIIALRVLPYCGTSMREYHNVLHKPECDECGGVLRPITKDGIRCPNVIYMVSAVINREDELVCEFTIYSTYNGHIECAFGSFIDSEEAADIVRFVENDELDDAYFLFEDACRRVDEIETEIEDEQ